MAASDALDFKEVFPKLASPFCYTGGDESITPVVNGTIVIPRKDYLELWVYADGAKTGEFRCTFPTQAEVSSGFVAGDFAGKLEEYATMFAAQCPRFGSYQHEVGEYGHHFRTSTNLKVISCGAANGYFDLVVTHSNGEVAAGISRVNYNNRSSSHWQHSGDTNHCNNLVHAATFQSSALNGDLIGHCIIVGYQKKPLHSWYGKSTGLFVVDLDAEKTYFVPLDLAVTTVAENTVIVPLMYRSAVADDGSKVLDWWIPTQMPTGMGDTGDVHDQPMVTERHRRFETPFAPKPRPTKPVEHAQAAAVPDSAAQGVKAETKEASVFDNDHALQLVCNPEMVMKSAGKINTLYWSRGLSLEDRIPKKAEERVLVPFIFSGEMLMCKAALLCRADGLSPCQVAASMEKRRMVIHVDGHQNTEASFLGARKALLPAESEGGTVCRLNAVFVVHIKDKSQMNLANLSIVSMFAGPRATVVFRAQDTGTCHAYWGTPGSVIPFSMSSEVNPEWTEFPSLLDAYLASSAPGSADDGNCLVPVPSHGSGSEGELKSMRAHSIHLGKTDVCFDDLQALLESHRLSDFATKESIVLHLFAFEFLLQPDDMEKVKSLVRSIFKSALSSQERIDFFNNMRHLSKADQEKIRNSAKLIDRLANRLCCRKYVSVNRFLAEFQEKLASHGQKGAEKMELGQQCLKFCKSGDPLDLFESDRDFMLVSVQADDIQAAVRAAGSSSREHRMRNAGALAWLDPRTPELDNTTVASLLSLGIPHQLEAEGAIQFAIPVQEGTYYGGGTATSLVFLPIFSEICPDLTQFDYTVWAYVLCEALKGSCLVPRDVQMKPRQVEYAVLQLLVSFMKSLCDQRKAPVDPESEDVNDTLVKKIRSVYWLIRAVMLKNVGIMTPEPICSVFSGKANHVFEIEIALEVLPLMNKTGLGPKFIETLRPALTEVFVRAVYLPLEGIFKSLVQQHRALVAEENKAATDFYKGAKTTTSDLVTARFRPKKCTKCLEMLTVHEFPRQRMLIKDDSAAQGWTHHTTAGPNLQMCLKCNGLPPRPTLVCPCKNCNKKTGTIFQFTAQDKYSAFATHHECISGSGKVHRQVPPKYCAEVGLTAAGEGAESAPQEMKLLVRCAADGPLAVNGGLPEFRLGALQELAISTTEVITFQQFVVLGTRLGLFSPTQSFSALVDTEPNPDDLKLLGAELRGILHLMLNNFTAVPPWKEIVPSVVDGKHKDAVQLMEILRADET